MRHLAAEVRSDGDSAMRDPNNRPSECIRRDGVAHQDLLAEYETREARGAWRRDPWHAQSRTTTRVTVRPTSLAAELGHVADNLYTRTLCGRAVYSLPFG